MEAIYLEREKDPNNMFSELDKGLHSLRIGDQCSAIVRYPQLFKTYPFPVMIKSSFVKLANVFRTGTNYIRLCIIQVTQKSSLHLNKITNVGEIVRCIHSVMHSNDPVARALTLNMLGSMVGVIADDKSVQHSIITSLDSNDKIEVKAALFAANAFASKSKSFSNIVCSKVNEVMDRWWVLVDFKISIIQVCRSMTCDAETSEKVRSLCLETLKKYPTVRFVTCVLHTLTIITSKHLMHLDEQIGTLMQYLQFDPRRPVQRVVLLDLALLASKLPHIWTEHYVEVLVSFSNSADPTTRLLVLKVLEHLSRGIAVHLISQHITDENSHVMQCVMEACLHDEQQISLLGLKVYVNACVHLPQGAENEVMQRLLSTAEMLLSTYYHQQHSEQIFKDALKSLSVLFKRHCSLSDLLLPHLCYLLSNNAPGNKAICDFLSCIQPRRRQHLHSTLTSQLSSFVACHSSVPLTPPQQDFVLSVIRVLLQTSRPGRIMESHLFKHLSAWIGCLDGWFRYKVARQASRYGHHDVSSFLFKQLTDMGTDEGQYCWLSGLEEYSRGQVMMAGMGGQRHELFDRLISADELFHKAIVNFKAAASATNQSSFQVNYVTLRSKLCLCLTKVLQACSSYQTLPPPAIASSLALTTGVDSQRCQHILIQLRGCSKQFRSLMREISCLHKRCFDADKNTILHLRRCHTVVVFVQEVLHKALSLAADTADESGQKYDEEVASGDDDDEDAFMYHGCDENDDDDDDEGNEEKMLNEWMEKVNVWLEELSEGHKNKALLSHEMIGLLERVVEGCSAVCTCVPRFFFQKLQRTDIKLAISPSMKSSEELIWTRCETGLVLKIEGIVSVDNKVKRFTHKPSSIRLIVKSHLISSYPHITFAVPSLPGNQAPLVKDCEICGDYFSHKFLLFFPTPGTHQVSIEARMVDKKGCVWLSDVRSYLGVQAEAVFKQTQLVK